MRHAGLTHALILTSSLSAAFVSAQTPTPTFDVVSIKRIPNPQAGGGGRTMPDGGQIMVNMAISQFITAAAPVPVRDVIGLPAWADRSKGGERYDVTVKPPAGATREQIRLMWQAMFAERMKLQAHVEEREHDTFALVVARSDGRLGPNLKPAAPECIPPAPGTPRPQTPPSADAVAQCGGHVGPMSMEFGITTMDSLAVLLGGGMVGRLVTNRTGLQGFYALTLQYAPLTGGPASNTAFNDAPEILTALQEQLGLKLQPEKSMVPVFVIDHIERPSEN